MSVRYAAHVSNWAWVLFGGAVTLAAAVVVVLWQAFKHLDLKIERLDDKIERLEDKIDKKFDDQRIYFDQKLDDQRNHFDQKFDQLMAGIAEVSRLVAGHDAQIKAQEKQIDRQEKQFDRLSEAVFAPPRFGAPSQHQERAHAEGAHQEEAHAPAAPAEAAAAPGESIASSSGGPEPTLPPAAIAPA